MALTDGIKLTLYKDCKISDDYKNVFSQKSYNNSSPFLLYLNSLSNYSIEIDEVYQENSTSFNFYLKDTDYGDIYKFNYMKIESYKDGYITLTRYAFINSITIVNDLGVINYKLDIWHSFCPQIVSINKSLIKGKRVINFGDYQPTYYKIPIEYEGNNELEFYPYENYNINSQCCLIIQIQYYNTQTYGEQSLAGTRYFLIKNVKRSEYYEDAWHHTTSVLTFSSIQVEIERICNFTGYQAFMDTSENDKLYFKIGKVYILPAKASLLSLFSSSGYELCSKDLGNVPPFYTTTLYFTYELFNPTISAYLPTLIENISIANDFKIKGIGLYGQIIPVSVNGSSLNYKILVSITRTSFTLYLNCENKLIEITDNFELDLVTTHISGEVLAQQKISRVLGNLTDINKLIEIATSFATGLNSSNNNFIKGSNLEDYYTSEFLEKGKGQVGLINSFSIQDNALANIGTAGISAVNSIGNLALNRSARNAPYYNSALFTKANNIAFINALKWIGLYKIIPDNEDFVKSSINEFGYNVFNYLTEIPFLNPETAVENNIYYDIIQFEYINVFGSFPHNIANELNIILKNGIKIWYNYLMVSDTYAVG